jgi:hypothetical protein
MSKTPQDMMAYLKARREQSNRPQVLAPSQVTGEVITYHGVAGNGQGGYDVLRVERGGRHSETVVATFATEEGAIADMRRRNA